MGPDSDGYRYVFFRARSVCCSASKLNLKIFVFSLSLA
jgi:hypothetical protein